MDVEWWPHHVTSPITVNPSATTLPDRFLLDRRRRILEEDFPVINSALVGVQQNQIAAGINNLVIETRQARVDTIFRQNAVQNKTPLDLLGQTDMLKLLRFTQQPTMATVPPIWTMLARSKKAQHLGQLQWEVNRIKKCLNEPDPPFLVDGGILEAIKGLELAMADNEAVATGFSA